jgi:hypothetical protein
MILLGSGFLFISDLVATTVGTSMHIARNVQSIIFHALILIVMGLRLVVFLDGFGDVFIMFSVGGVPVFSSVEEVMMTCFVS